MFLPSYLSNWFADFTENCLTLQEIIGEQKRLEILLDPEVLKLAEKQMEVKQGMLDLEQSKLKGKNL